MTTTSDVVCLRPAQVGDERRVTAMARRLSQNSLCQRFMAIAATNVAIDELCREICGGANDFAYVAQDKHNAVVGLAYAALLGDQVAEAAFVVADHYQHKGIGSALFAVLVREAGTRGIRTLLIETFALNVDMLRIVTRSKLAYVQQRLGDTIEIRLNIPGAQSSTSGRLVRTATVDAPKPSLRDIAWRAGKRDVRSA